MTQERDLRYWTWDIYVTPSLMGYMVGFNFDLFTLTSSEIFYKIYLSFRNYTNILLDFKMHLISLVCLMVTFMYEDSNAF